MAICQLLLDIQGASVAPCKCASVARNTSCILLLHRNNTVLQGFEQKGISAGASPSANVLTDIDDDLVHEFENPWKPCTVEGFGDSGCGGYRNLLSDCGVLKTVGFPGHDYPNNSLCEWHIHVSPRHRIILSIDVFEMEESVLTFCHKHVFPAPGRGADRRAYRWPGCRGNFDTCDP
ncbi:hypothetical protein Bbelb_058710 [Branchiostoma belcheri]|nr:hypothetical protein Bbelb_058710 [Branchiostoma belcheri]